MSTVNTGKLDRVLEERAKRRGSISRDLRQVEALEGVFDELTKLNASIALLSTKLGR